MKTIELTPDEIEKDDDGNCAYCGHKCWNGEMCDEQQAGGFNKLEESPEPKTGSMRGSFNLDGSHI